jgi:hypothetical protein
MFCVFSHQNEWSLTISSNWDMDIVEFRNNRWFLSFQTTHAHNRQMSCKKERLARRPPRECVNCIKWSDMVWGSTDESHELKLRRNDLLSIFIIEVCTLSFVWVPLNHETLSFNCYLLGTLHIICKIRVQILILPLIYLKNWNSYLLNYLI